ncbi:unnamed protein product [Schistosoma mattheei]|uniref:Uncharacterized protein n=1 Tax=Schistosoma mattheei TaxID=31246 RepID=A0A183Q5T4_9TREM|nr:unnamed protein product [Schistosoma mattheei]
MENINTITLDGENLEEMETFMYLDNIIDEQGGFGANSKARIGKVRTTFTQLNNIWNSKQLSESSIPTSKQFYCMELELGELSQPSSKMYKYL